MLPSHSKILAGAISMHRIFTHMYLTVSIGPSYIESLTGFLHVPPPLRAFLHISPLEPLPSVPYLLFLHQTKKKKKKINKKNHQKNTKGCSYPSLPRNDPITPHLKFNSLTIRPLMHVLFVTPKPLYN